LSGPGQAEPRIHADVDSPSMPGLKSCVSDPLEPWCTFAEFYSEFFQLMMEPINPTEFPAVQKVEVTREGPEECTVKVFMDAELLRAMEVDFPQRNAKRGVVLKMWFRMTWNHAKREVLLHTKEHNAGEKHGVTLTVLLVKFLKDPFRVELVCTLNTQGADNKVVAEFSEYAWLRPIVRVLRKRKVKLSRDVISPVTGGDCVVISDPLPEHISYDALFDRYVAMCKYNSDEVEELSPCEFGLIFTSPLAYGSAKVPLKRVVRHDKAKGEIVVVSSVHVKLLETLFILFHRDPLRVEAWTEAGGQRKFRRLNAEAVQYLCDTIVKETAPDSGRAAESACSVS